MKSQRWIILTRWPGYPTTPYLLRPFAENELQDDRQRRKKFNQVISGSRVLIECTFGRLKARFQSLSLMGHSNEIKDTYHTVAALIVLHNLCYDYHDTVNGLPDAFTQRAQDRLERRRKAWARQQCGAQQGDEMEDESDEESSGEENSGNESPPYEDDLLYDEVGQIQADDIDENEPSINEEVDLLREGELFRALCVDIVVPN
jgi:hypothetical protein